MRIEIELDPSKIDYDDINRQIREKLENTPLSELTDIKSVVDRRIIEKTDEAHTLYMQDYYSQSQLTTKGETYVDGILKETMKEKVSEDVKKICEEINISEIITGIMKDSLGRIIVDKLSEIVHNNYYSSLQNMKNEQHCEAVHIANSIINTRLNGGGY